MYFTSKNDCLFRFFPNLPCVTVQSSEGSDEGRSPGQRFAASRGQERQPSPALLREAHREPPQPHRGAPPQTTNSTTFYKYHTTVNFFSGHFNRYLLRAF